MNIESLLEKHEESLLTLIRELLLKHKNASMQTLSDSLHLSRASLENLLNEIPYLGHRLGAEMMIVRTNHAISLKTETSFNLDEVINFLIKESLNYRLLCLLENNRLTSYQLADSLFISEATLFRKIKNLNSLLSEFGLEIKNNQIIGEELQIHYFYYLLDSLIEPCESDASQQKFQENCITALEAELNVTFSEASQERIFRWLSVGQRRGKNFVKVTDKKVSMPKKYHHSDYLYRAVHLALSPFLPLSEIFLFYRFLLTFYILGEEDFYRFAITRKVTSAGARLNIFVRERVLSNYNYRRLAIADEKSINYQLAQVNNKFIFFKGSLLSKRQALWMADKESQADKNSQELIPRLQEAALTLFPDRTDVTELIFGYRCILSLLASLSSSLVRVSYDFSDNAPYQSYLAQFFQHLFKNENILFVPYSSGKSCDLVICSQHSQTPLIGTSEYVLSESLDEDAKQVLALIHQIEKNNAQKKIQR